MLTFQDLQEAQKSQKDTIDFIQKAINQHKSSAIYQTALIADEYNRKENRTIKQYQKMLFDAAGQPTVDIYSANYKLRSNFFNRFVTQQNQFLLGNGVRWGKDETAGKLGGDLIPSCRTQERRHSFIPWPSVFGISTNSPFVRFSSFVHFTTKRTERFEQGSDSGR